MITEVTKLRKNQVIDNSNDLTDDVKFVTVTQCDELVIMSLTCNNN